MIAAYAFLFVLNLTTCVVCLKQRCLLHCDCTAALILPTAAWFAVEAAVLPAYLGPVLTLSIAELGALIMLLRLVDDHDRWLPIIICALALVAAMAGLLDLVGFGMAEPVRRVIALAAWSLASGLTIASGLTLLLDIRRWRPKSGIARRGALG
ncbi:MAG: hypothetical protein ACKOPM_16870 [Novosphingobium sp.]